MAKPAPHTRIPDTPVFGRLRLALGPFDQQPFLRPRLAALPIEMGGEDAQAGEARLKRRIGPLPPANRPPGLGGKAERQGLDRGRPMLGVAAQPFGRAPASGRVGLGRQGLPAWRPHRGGRQNACDIAQPEFRDRRPQRAVDAVACVHQHHSARQTGGDGRADLIERDLRLGLERNLFGNAGLLAAGGVRGPGLRQIKPIGDRQARMRVGQRQRNRRLAIVLLAELAAILARHSDRMLPFLGKPVSSTIQALIGPCASMAATPSPEPWPAPSRPTSRPVRQMQKRLVLRRRPLRRRSRRERLHALALAGQQKPSAIITQRLCPVGVADHAHKTGPPLRRALGEAYRAAVACLRDDLDELLTCFRYKTLSQRRAVRTTNAIERRFLDVRRRTRPMGVFQARTSMGPHPLRRLHARKQNAGNPNPSPSDT